MIGIAAAIPFVTFLLKPESLNEITFSDLKILENISLNNELTIIICLIFFFNIFI